MPKVIIIGAGFAGLSAACILAKSRLKLEIILIDKKETADFLPLLPDVIGRGIDPRILSYDISSFCRRMKIGYLKEEVTEINLGQSQIVTRGKAFNYDYAIIACGSETNFYGNQDIRQSAFKLDDTEDARRIKSAASDPTYQHYLVSGGGYTGIEVATNLRISMNRFRRNPKISVVERAPLILGPLPEWMKEYVAKNLKKMDIQIKVNTAIEKIEGRTVFLSSKEILEDCAVIWAAGVKTAGFLQRLGVEKNPQGRIRVDEYLRLNQSCFIAGDASYFKDKESYLRMAVQFAIREGGHAARNIIRSLKGLDPVHYKPFDFGYIIPMANNVSCGLVLGINLKGLVPTLLHYLMCIFRLRGFGNKLGLFWSLIKRR